MSFNRMVGEAYILLRGDGRRLKRDFEQIGKDGFRPLGEGFQKELDRSAEESMVNLRKKLARATTRGDFTIFKAPGESDRDFFRRWDTDLQKLTRNAGFSASALAQINRAWREQKEILESSIGEREKLQRDKDHLAIMRRTQVTMNDLNEDIARSGGRWDNLYPKIVRATSSGDWSPLIKQGESLEDALDRVNRQMEANRREHRMSDDVYRTTTRRWREWVDAMIQARDQAERKATLDREGIARDRAYNSVMRGRITTMNELNEALDRHASKWNGLRDPIERALASGDWERLRRSGESLEDAFRRVERVMGDLSRQQIISKDANDEIIRQYRDWTDQAVRLRDAEERNARLIRDNAALKEQEARRLQTLARYTDRFKDSLEGLGPEIARAFETGEWDRLHQKGEDLDLMGARLTETFERFRSQGRLTAEGVRDLSDSFDRWRGRVVAVGDDIQRVERGSDRIVFAMRRGRAATDIFAFGMGRAFGRGSRNDFVNFVGVVVGGMARVVTSLPVAIVEKAAAAVGRFQEGMALAGSEAGTFAKLAGGITRVFGGPGGVAALIAGAAAGLFLFGKFIPGIAALVSMLAGTITMLIGSIGIGLVGALLALTPVVLAGAGAVGLLVAAFARLSESESAKAAFEGLKAEINEVADTLVPKLERIIESVTPRISSLFGDMGVAVGNVLDDLYDRINDPSMDQFYKKWGQSLPKIAEDVGKAFNALGQGLTAFFVPILPYAEKLAENFRLMMERFSNWARSAEGQNSIANFMEVAWESANKVWDIIVEIGKIIGKVFFAGAQEGNETFLDKILGKLEEFSAWLDTVEGKKALSDWFEDASEFASDLWDIISDLGEAFDNLDTEESRKSLSDFLDTVEDVTGAIETLAGWTESMGKAWDEMWAGLTGSSGPTQWGNDLGRKLNQIFTDIGNTINEWVYEKAAQIGEWASETWDSISTWASDTKESFTTWASETGETISTFFSELPGKVGEWLSGVKESISTWTSETWESFSTWASETGETIGTFFSELPGKVGEALSEFGSSVYEIFREGMTQAMDAVAEGLNELADYILNFSFEEAWETFKTGLSGVGEAIGTWVTDTVSDINDWATETEAKFIEWRTGVEETIQTWASETWESVSTWVSDTAADFEKWVKEIPEKFEKWKNDTKEKVSTWASETGESIQKWANDTGAKIEQWVKDIPNKLERWKNTAKEKITTWASEVKSSIEGWVNDTAAKVEKWKNDTVAKFEKWKNDSKQKVSEGINKIGEDLRALPGKAAEWLSSLPEKMLTPVKNAWSRIDSEFNGAPGRLAAAAGRVVSAISTRLWGAVDTLVSPFRDAWSKIQGLISNITSAPGNIKSTIGRLIPKFASGGILYGPRTIIAGEAGAEAIVPLNRPLSMVDPSVRALSAVAQGKMSPAMLTGATGKSINVEAGAISVQSPNSDPELVAQSVLDRLVNEIL